MRTLYIMQSHFASKAVSHLKERRGVEQSTVTAHADNEVNFVGEIIMCFSEAHEFVLDSREHGVPSDQVVLQH